MEKIVWWKPTTRDGKELRRKMCLALACKNSKLMRNASAYQSAFLAKASTTRARPDNQALEGVTKRKYPLLLKKVGPSNVMVDGFKYSLYGEKDKMKESMNRGSILAIDYFVMGGKEALEREGHVVMESDEYELPEKEDVQKALKMRDEIRSNKIKEAKETLNMTIGPISWGDTNLFRSKVKVRDAEVFLPREVKKGIVVDAILPGHGVAMGGEITTYIPRRDKLKRKVEAMSDAGMSLEEIHRNVEDAVNSKMKMIRSPGVMNETVRKVSFAVLGEHFKHSSPMSESSGKKDEIREAARFCVQMASEKEGTKDLKRYIEKSTVSGRSLLEAIEEAEPSTHEIMLCKAVVGAPMGAVVNYPGCTFTKETGEELRVGEMIRIGGKDFIEVPDYEGYEEFHIRSEGISGKLKKDGNEIKKIDLFFETGTRTSRGVLTACLLFCRDRGCLSKVLKSDIDHKSVRGTFKRVIDRASRDIGYFKEISKGLGEGLSQKGFCVDRMGNLKNSSGGSPCLGKVMVMSVPVTGSEVKYVAKVKLGKRSATIDGKVVSLGQRTGKKSKMPGFMETDDPGVESEMRPRESMEKGIREALMNPSGFRKECREGKGEILTRISAIGEAYSSPNWKKWAEEKLKEESGMTLLQCMKVAMFGVRWRTGVNWEVKGSPPPEDYVMYVNGEPHRMSLNETSGDLKAEEDGTIQYKGNGVERSEDGDSQWCITGGYNSVSVIQKFEKNPNIGRHSYPTLSAYDALKSKPARFSMFLPVGTVCFEEKGAAMDEEQSSLTQDFEEGQTSNIEGLLMSLVGQGKIDDKSAGKLRNAFLAREKEMDEMRKPIKRRRFDRSKAGKDEYSDEESESNEESDDDEKPSTSKRFRKEESSDSEESDDEEVMEEEGRSVSEGTSDESSDDEQTKAIRSMVVNTFI